MRVLLDISRQFAGKMRCSTHHITYERRCWIGGFGTVGDESNDLGCRCFGRLLYRDYFASTHDLNASNENHDYERNPFCENE